MVLNILPSRASEKEEDLEIMVTRFCLTKALDSVFGKNDNAKIRHLSMCLISGKHGNRDLSPEERQVFAEFIAELRT